MKINIEFELTDRKDQADPNLSISTIEAQLIKHLTGMYHLCEEWSDNSEENNKSLKESLIGNQLIVEEAHWADDRRIYRSVYPEFEYWSDLELEIGEKIR